MKNQVDEKYIIELIREGKANKEIAQLMYKPKRTIDDIIRRLLRKHNCRNRVELAIKTLTGST
jgi:DNA-binding NarL/FixJ family response regulator